MSVVRSRLLRRRGWGGAAGRDVLPVLEGKKEEREKSAHPLLTAGGEEEVPGLRRCSSAAEGKEASQERACRRCCPLCKDRRGREKNGMPKDGMHRGKPWATGCTRTQMRGAAMRCERDDGCEYAVVPVAGSGWHPRHAGGCRAVRERGRTSVLREAACSRWQSFPCVKPHLLPRCDVER